VNDVIIKEKKPRDSREVERNDEVMKCRRERGKEKNREKEGRERENVNRRNLKKGDTFKVDGILDVGRDV
jgi:hypothetical protein